MNITVYSPSQQAVGSFDGGKITEQKPIGFSGEGSAVKRIGPLFYWAWAKAKEEGYIPLHPHQAFEIITYVIQGQAEHGDTLGTKSIVGAGGAQVMQTGSGVSHEERFIGPDMEAFQIWFEPFIQEAIKREPQYQQFAADQFPLEKQKGIQIKSVIGGHSPIQITADVKMWDLQLSNRAVYTHSIPSGYTLAVLALRGDGSLQGDREVSFQEKDFVVIEAEMASNIQVSISESKARFILIQVPMKTDYTLYPK